MTVYCNDFAYFFNIFITINANDTGISFKMSHIKYVSKM